LRRLNGDSRDVMEWEQFELNPRIIAAVKKGWQEITLE